MTECINNTLIPLSKVVSAALVDTYADYGQSYQMYSHWAARRFKTLARQSLKLGKRYAKLTVNKNTHTATLPADFKQELFIGYLNRHGYKIGLPLRTEFTNAASISKIEASDPCRKCSQSKSICDELTITESEETVVVNGSNYTLTTIKKLYSNGNYYLEKTIPYYNTVTHTVQYTTTKEFIDTIELMDCGCPEKTHENIEKIRCCCESVYGNYYAQYYHSCDTAIGGYRIMEDIGLIQLDRKFTLDELYIEYTGFLPKINGQLAIPEIAFETVVKGVVEDAIASKRNVGLGEKQWHHQRYLSARSAMDKELGLVSLDQIMQAVSLIPKFDVSYRFRMDICGAQPQVTQLSICLPSDTACSTISGGSATSLRYLAPFEISYVVPSDTLPNTFTFTSSELIGALNLNAIIVNNNNETKDYGDFTFDATAGTITRVNPFIPGNVIIIPFAKYVNA